MYVWSVACYGPTPKREDDLINHAGKGSLVVADPVGWLVDMNMRLHKEKKNGERGPFTK